MEQQSPRISPDHLITEKEKEVCEILLNLPFLIKKSESYIGLTPWANKGKRSFATSSPRPPRHLHLPKKKAKTDIASSSVPAGVSSPATSLSFLPSKVDDKTLQISRNTTVIFKKKTREELLVKIEELEKTNKSLTGELEKVKSYHKERKAYNAVLKANREELQYRARVPNREPSKVILLENTCPNKVSLENHQKIPPHFSDLHQHNFISQYNQTSTGLPDLNAMSDDILEEKYCQPSDLKIQFQGDDD